MTDEETKEAVTDKVVTDAELESKTEIKEELSEKKDEIKETKKELEDADDHAERSRLGRRLKRQEEQLSNLESKMDAFFTRMEGLQRQPATQDINEEELTDEDLRKYNLARKKEKQAEERYSQNYTSNFRKIGIKDDADTMDDVWDEMYAHFNNVVTGDPSVDAEINYAKAKASLLTKKMATVKPKANVKSERSATSTNLNVQTHQEVKEDKDVELDADAKEFVAKTGMKIESVREALKGEAPIHLQSRK